MEDANPSKFYYHFLYKTLIVSTFLIILANFPSQATDFINQTLNTRGWEFLHLVFVGIAISYGLFSRRNDDEPEKDNKNNSNSSSNYYSNDQSYVSRMIQCSIFGEEADSPTGSSPSSSDGEKFQSWSNQYLRNDPIVVVAEESPVLGKEENIIVSEKPLFLPVRRLKYHTLGDPGREKKQEKVIKDQVVGPSPSPWRSIPGRIDIGDDDHPEAQASRSSASQPSSSCSSPRISPPAQPSVISSPRKLAEDLVRKKSFYRPPPPPPPPQPPQLFRKAVSMKQIYRVADQKDVRKSFSGEEAKGLNFPRSVRTIRSGDWLAMPRKDEHFNEEKDEAESEGELEVEDHNGGCACRSMAAAGSRNEEGADQGSSGDGGPDVDKKADEFIARFREQIRLQRIETIKSVQVTRNSSR